MRSKEDALVVKLRSVEPPGHIGKLPLASKTSGHASGGMIAHWTEDKHSGHDFYAKWLLARTTDIRSESMECICQCNCVGRLAIPPILTSGTVGMRWFSEQF
jgi:hypothetical protein